MTRFPSPLRAVLCALAGLFLPAATLAERSAADVAWDRLRARSVDALTGLALGDRPAASDPAVPELSFDQFFGPVGEEGLTYSARLQSLAGKRVRIAGYMVREPQRERGVFVLVQHTGTAHAQAGCIAPHLPPAVVYVHLPPAVSASRIPFVPGRHVLIGTLELGVESEPGGRNSWVRLRMEYVPFRHGAAESAGKS